MNNPPIVGQLMAALVAVFFMLLLAWGIVWAFNGFMRTLVG